MNEPLKESVSIRPLTADDSIEELTLLLHRAYKRLADMGLKYVATHQSPDITRKRIGTGVCLVAERGGRIIGTILYRTPDTPGHSPWLDRPEVAHISQFAVEPELQKQGIGCRLIAAAEERAIADGASELALDTAESAVHLIRFYERLGYRYIEPIDWRPHTNYLSIVMSKALGR